MHQNFLTLLSLFRSVLFVSFTSINDYFIGTSSPESDKEMMKVKLKPCQPLANKYGNPR